MRWVRKNKKQYHGDTRIRSGFLFFPRTINNETRWLEQASWSEMLIPSEMGGPLYWANLKWLDKENNHSTR